jgi:hypothetical protein
MGEISHMKSWIRLTATCCLIIGTSGNTLAVDSSRTVLEFDTMVGVDGPFLGTSNPIRGVNGGGLPWILDRGKGELEGNGTLSVEVRGLVIPGACNGVDCNPAPFFRAIVSCLTVEDGIVVERNVATENGAEVMIGDPTAGDAEIEAMLQLPDPCVAPIVFVTSPTGSWFAATGMGVIP